MPNIIKILKLLIAGDVRYKGNVRRSHAHGREWTRHHMGLMKEMETLKQKQQELEAVCCSSDDWGGCGGDTMGSSSHSLFLALSPTI